MKRSQCSLRNRTVKILLLPGARVAVSFKQGISKLLPILYSTGECSSKTCQPRLQAASSLMRSCQCSVPGVDETKRTPMLLLPVCTHPTQSGSLPKHPTTTSQSQN
ncbi:hypothetical protein PVAP13_9NG818277 [Panicum virgatum]|uniref:Uncharacterized protein n=1 Tax=Panicum virgatum TaxID=38727 RepID=A0A8T0MZ99_PANVG|nr:hypothetical protein PVAP13_9NG818277 [Panicum virgatum]